MKNKSAKISILYIGSAPDTLKSLSEADYFSITQKENSLDAFNHVRKHHDIEAIISEVHLPGANGFDTFKLFAKHEICKQKPFILFAQEYESELPLKALSEGLDDFYLTPVDNNRIKERLEFLFEKKKNSNIPFIETDPVIPYHTPIYKRIFDIIGAFIALVLLSPLMLLVIIAIKIESKGPFYYISPRAGANFKVFGFIKFRSMYSGSDSTKKLKELSHLNQYVTKEYETVCSECKKLPHGEFCSPILYIKGERICENLYIKQKNTEQAFMKLENDPRITKVGKFIRNTSIDELPQLFNILKGDMSIVGNRPLPVNEAEKLTVDFRAKRFETAAGLTGLWQVEQRGKNGPMSEEERFRLDNEYAKNNSFLGDLKLILKTFKIIIQRANV
jgi:lipopolysaccharide/colanic/teichoic acid biosynthesis glycosyltransferase